MKIKDFDKTKATGILNVREFLLLICFIGYVVHSAA